MANKKGTLTIAVTRCDKKATEVVIPEGVVAIQSSAFSGCESLASVTIPKSMRAIGINVFKGCTSLAEIRFEGTMAQWEKVKKNVLSFGRHSGDNCINYITCTDGNVPLPYYFIKNGILKWWCFGDTKAIIPASVTKIEKYAFQNCNSLVSVTIPKSVKEIGDNVFDSCTSLLEIRFDGTRKQWDEVEKNAGWFANSVLTYVKCTDGDVPLSKYVIKHDVLELWLHADTEIIIPEGVKEIGDRAFSGLTSLTSITIPSSIKEICIGAFSNCKSLVSVTMVKGLKKIDHFAFCNCESLTSIAIPEGINKIGGSVFQNCTSLASVTIPKSIKELGGVVFDGCISLSEIRFGGTMEQWEAVKKQDTWKGSEMFGGCIPAKVVHCTNGDIPL